MSNSDDAQTESTYKTRDMSRGMFTSFCTSLNESNQYLKESREKHRGYY